MRSWNTEFPDMAGIEPMVDELVAAGYTDTSWHNDEGASFQREHVLDGKAVTITVWIGYENPDHRVSPYRYGMSIKHSGSDVDYADIGTDSWTLMRALIKA